MILPKSTVCARISGSVYNETFKIWFYRKIECNKKNHLLYKNNFLERDNDFQLECKKKGTKLNGKHYTQIFVI